MAKDGGAAEVMSAAELKPLLNLSKRQKVNCAIGMTKDRQGVILLHKRTKPRKLMAELLRQQSATLQLDRGSLRFGHASVDGSSDRTTVHFTVNKTAPDTLRMMLLERLRPAGYQHCDINVDDELESETEPGEDQVTAKPDAGKDAAALKAELRELVERARPVVAADAALLKLAAAARDGLGRGSLDVAAAAIAELRQRLEMRGHKPGSPVFARGQAAWLAVRSKLQADIDAALKGMAAVYGADDERARVVHGRVEPIMQRLDDSLAVKLAEVAANTAPDVHARLVKEAQAIIGRYRAFVDGEAMIAGLDANPFHPVAIGKTLDTALSALSRLVETAA